MHQGWRLYRNQGLPTTLKRVSPPPGAGTHSREPKASPAQRGHVGKNKRAEAASRPWMRLEGEALTFDALPILGSGGASSSYRHGRSSLATLEQAWKRDA